MEAEQLVDRKFDKSFLIVDQGGHASRAVVMDESGMPVAWAERPLGTSRPQSGYVEHDPKELLETIRQCLTEVTQKVGDRSKTVQAAGLATQRSSIVCWDSHTGEALSPVISWQDTRAKSQIRSFSSQAGEVHERTGLFLSAHYGASKLAWCFENIPGVKKAMEADRLCMGPMSSFIVWQLTDEKRFVTDPVSASRTLLWNIHRREWDQHLLNVFNIPARTLPVCVSTLHDFGKVKMGEHRAVLSLVTGDQSAAMYAFGKLQPDTAYVNLGTGAFVSRPIGPQPILSQGLLTSVSYEQDGVSEYVLEGTVNGAGSAIQWVQDTYGIKDVRKLLPVWLREIDTPPLFLNGISGLGSPYWMPDFISSFIGESNASGKVVAVVESIVFLLYRNMVEMGGRLKAPKRIQITGGLSTLDGICQLLADLTEIPAYRPVQTEATTRGTYYLLAGSPDHWPEPSPGRWFEPVGGTAIAERYDRWLEAVEKRVKEIREKG
jgi:glycerol kinase